jgi:hypothetical protein
MTRAWFYYNDVTGGWQLANNYTYRNFQPQCSVSGERICAILAIYDPDTYGNHPAPFMDTDLHGYLIEAQATSSPQPSAVCPYVLIKP